MDALARHLSATWEPGEAPPDAYLVTAERRIAIDTASIRPRVPDHDGPATPRLRLDRVALRFVEGLRAALNDAVPDGATVMVTVTAPIRQPAKTMAALEATIRRSLAQQPAPRELRETIHGNEVGVRLATSAASGNGSAKLVGFVHNPEPPPDALLDLAQALIKCIGAGALRPKAARLADERWLLIVDESERVPVETTRHVGAQLSAPAAFRKILMLLAGGRIETLAE